MSGRPRLEDVALAESQRLRDEKAADRAALFRKRHEEGLTPLEIGRRIGVGADTVRSALRRMGFKPNSTGTRREAWRDL